MLETINFIQFRTKSLGGGTILDIGVYCVQLASFVFGGEKPIRILSGGHLNEDGIDESTSSTLLYSRGLVTYRSHT